ncbi:MAG: PilZ domain-containing protein [Planctomycetota bacterium]|jgi:hypothetical protein
MSSEIKVDNRSSVRHDYQTPVEFIIEGDVLDAKSVNISDTGIRFDTEKPLRFTLRFRHDSQNKVIVSDLVWAKRMEDGSMSYGLDFVDLSKEK